MAASNFRGETHSHVGRRAEGRSVMNSVDYTQQSPAVAERFRKIKERPVVLEIDHLGRQFPSEHGMVTALKDICFKVHRREFVCVIGPSGCGKSTLIRMVAGLDQPTSGRM